MTIDAIIQGESKNVEFKAALPKDSERYIKTIIAFANTQGGKLIIGVDDKTRTVVGIDEDILFPLMDSISNAVSDSCSPQIVPNVGPQTVNGRTVIVVTVAPGPHRPYYLRSKGVTLGTYIRVAGTSRPAHPEKIRELEMEGARISWDELTCVGYPVDDHAVTKLCSDVMRFREQAGSARQEVTRTQLINWKLIKKIDGRDAASNAFVLLTSDHFPFSKTQCALFKGTERDVFLDKRTFTGPIYEQIEDALTFVLRNIRLGARIDGLVRKEAYELPVGAIREMIVNAHCHRNLTDESCVQVAVYDDRLEVTSPGGLYNGLTFEEIMNGHSKLRNRTIANILGQMGLVEAWGTGIKRIIKAAQDHGLPAPRFQAFDDMFRVELFRAPASDFLQGNVHGASEMSQQNIDEKAAYLQRTIGDTAEDHQRYIGGVAENHQRYCGGVAEDHRRYIGGIAEDHRRYIGGIAEDYQRCIGEIAEDHRRYPYGVSMARYDDPSGGAEGLMRTRTKALNETQQKILFLLSRNAQLSASKMAEQIQISRRNVEANIKKLKERGILIRHGSPKNGYWEIVQ